MARVFILGAGASKFAGYPLGLELWSFIRDSSFFDEIDKRAANSVREERERILNVIPPEEYDRPNIEELFTLLDLADRGTTGIVGLRHSTWRLLRPKVMRMISWAFRWHEPELRDRDVAFVLQKWTDFLQEGDTIESILRIT